MTAIREITKVRSDCTIEVRNPALLASDQVEVIVLVPARKLENHGDPYAFLKVLENAELDGPPDWSVRLDDSLSGQRWSIGNMSIIH